MLFFCLFVLATFSKPRTCLRIQVSSTDAAETRGFQGCSSVISENWEGGLYHIVPRIQSEKWKEKEQLVWEPFHSRGRSEPRWTPSTQQRCEILRPPISLGMGRGRSRAGRTTVQCTSRCIPNSPQRRGLLGKTQPNDHYFQEHQ